MKILMLDPGLSQRKGHNAAIAEELSLELAHRPDVEISYAGTLALAPAAFADLTGTFLPTFRLDGYSPIARSDMEDASRWNAIQSLIVQEMAGLRPGNYDIIVMPTAYPLHLHALARLGPALAGTRILCGLLLPPRFWARAPDAEPGLVRFMGEAIAALQGAADALFYTETGRYPLASASIPTPILLPPVSDATLRTMEQLEEARTPPSRSWTLGYFGSPFTSKGFALLIAAIERGLPDHVRVVLRLPPGSEDFCAKVNAASPRVDATSRAMTNAEFLREMADVDVVYALYDPAHYGDKMSGIVPEAICLGLPVLLCDGCTALVEFLERNAPGSFASAPYTLESLRAALQLPAAAWRGLQDCARQSAPVVRAHKRAQRYLTIAGAGALYARTPVLEDA